MKTIAAFLLLSSSVLAQARAVISGPDSIAPGDLLILSSDESYGDDFNWLLTNSNKNFLAVEGNRTCIFASGQPGRYTFVLSVSKAEEGGGSTVSAVFHTVTVGNPSPDPEPDPDPDPDPDPPGPALSAVARRVRDSVASIDYRASEVRNMAENARSVATTRESMGWDIDDMKSRFAELNRENVFTSNDVKSRWTEFSSVFVSIMREASTPAEAGKLLIEVARGLESLSDSGSFSSSSRDPINAGLRETVNALRGTVKEIRSTVDSTHRDVDEIWREIGRE